jgi:hypothetical protein
MLNEEYDAVRAHLIIRRCWNSVSQHTSSWVFRQTNLLFRCQRVAKKRRSAQRRITIAICLPNRRGAKRWIIAKPTLRASLLTSYFFSSSIVYATSAQKKNSRYKVITQNSINSCLTFCLKLGCDGSLPLIKVVLGQPHHLRASDRKPRKEQQPHPNLIPQKGTTKNKSPKSGAFFEPQKPAAKTPRSPRNPPRFHHQNTTRKRPFLPKPPAKTHITTPEKIAATSSFLRLCLRLSHRITTKPPPHPDPPGQAALTPKNSNSLYPPNAGEILLLPANRSAHNLLWRSHSSDQSAIFWEFSPISRKADSCSETKQTKWRCAQSSKRERGQSGRREGRS